MIARKTVNGVMNASAGNHAQGIFPPISRVRQRYRRAEYPEVRHVELAPKWLPNFASICGAVKAQGEALFVPLR
jgi:hypothetical protein